MSRMNTLVNTVVRAAVGYAALAGAVLAGGAVTAAAQAPSADEHEGRQADQLAAIGDRHGA